MGSSSSKPMIEITDLKKSYGEFQALGGLNFSVPAGQIVGFLGPNGAGKSTTMKIITGYLPYSTGSVKIAGIEVSESSEETRALIGYLPENNPQYEDMMVIEYLNFIAEIRKIPKEFRASKIERAVTRCGLKEMLGKDIGQLSKGYRQRVGLAQAILHDPKLLILDEPTSGLDPNQIIEIRNLIKELGKETTILMSTHILQEAQSTCQRILIINNGLLVADDSPEQLAESSTGAINIEVMPSVENSINVNNFIGELKKISGVSSVEHQELTKTGHLLATIRFDKGDPRKEVFDAVINSKLILLEMGRKKASLEEIFRKLTSNN